MEFWDTIINAALMGTDKKQISANDLPPAIGEAAVLISENPEKDKEDKFLQIAAILLNYRQCGTKPLHKEISIQAADAEEKQYCSQKGLDVLKDIILEDNIHLLNFWLKHCNDKRVIVMPEMVPVLLGKSAEHKKLQYLVAACCGKRGEWLGKLNTAWNFSSTQTGEELWQTGTFEQRKEILRQIRTINPAKGREWVQQTWPQEDAASKTALLEILADNLSAADIPFLESLDTEKGKKVKEMAAQLLKQIPGSAIIRMYEKMLSQSVHVKKEKALLGMMSKTVLVCKLPDNPDDAIFKTGIDKLSNIKELSDDEYVISQLLEFVPPVFWENHLQMSPAHIIDLFQKDPNGKKLIPAFVRAISRFKDAGWALNFMDHSQVFYIDIIPLLQEQLQEQFSNKLFDRYPDDVIQYAVRRKSEWSIELAVKIIRHAAKNPYQYNRSFFSQQIHLLPVNISGELETCTPQEEHFRSGWNSMSDYIMKLTSLKIQTIKAFTS
jgi:hypothetical protein